MFESESSAPPLSLAANLSVNECQLLVQKSTLDLIKNAFKVKASPQSCEAPASLSNDETIEL